MIAQILNQLDWKIIAQVVVWTSISVFLIKLANDEYK